MDKTELISAVADKVGLSKKQVREVINEILSQIAKQLVLGQKVKLVGFGTFSKQYRAARDGRNPRTGERLIIPERHVVVFSPGSDLKQQVQELSDCGEASEGLCPIREGMHPVCIQGANKLLSVTTRSSLRKRT
jgi:nucleoid DNA-binding protein